MDIAAVEQKTDDIIRLWVETTVSLLAYQIFGNLKDCNPFIQQQVYSIGLVALEEIRKKRDNGNSIDFESYVRKISKALELLRGFHS